MFVTSKEVRDVMTNSHPGGLDTIGARPIPPNIFGMGFGLAGLATAWRIAVDQHLALHEVSDVLIGLAALGWLISRLPLSPLCADDPRAPYVPTSTT